MKRILALILSMLLILTLASCGGLQQQIEDAVNGALGNSPSPESSSSGGTSGSSSKDADRSAEIEKHNAYIDLFNCLINDVDRVVYDYTDEFGYEEEIEIPSNFSGFSMYSNNIIKFLDAAIPYTSKKPAVNEADATLIVLEPALRTYANALDDARKYYEERGYVDDDFAKAKDYHSEIIGQYEAIWVKIEDFLDAVDIMLEGQDELALQEYKDDGSMIHYWALQTLIDAQAMTHYLNENDFSDETTLEIKLEEFRPLYDAFVVSYGEYNTVAAEADGSSSSTYIEGIFASSIRLYTDQLKEVKSCAAALVERLQNGSEPSSSDIIRGDGTPDGLRDEVSGLLSDYNSWIIN